MPLMWEVVFAKQDHINGACDLGVFMSTKIVKNLLVDFYFS